MGRDHGGNAIAQPLDQVRSNHEYKIEYRCIRRCLTIGDICCRFSFADTVAESHHPRRCTDLALPDPSLNRVNWEDEAG